MIIDKLYLEESKRIRLEYLNNLAYIVLKEDKIRNYIQKLEDIQNEFDNLDNINNESYYKDKLNEINFNIDKLKNYINFYHNNIVQLDKDQRLLYENIKSKYNNITDDDMKNQIIEYIKDVNKEFIDKNPLLYKKNE